MTEIHSAAPELLALAAVMRPDWDQRDLSGAMSSAFNNGWPFPKAALAAVRLMCDPDSEARDLLAETRDPLKPATASPAPATPEFTAARLALAASVAGSAQAGDADA
jgi:hypothetical protein